MIARLKDAPNLPTGFTSALSSGDFAEVDINVEDDLIITDDNVLMEYLNIQANLDWRRGYINNVAPDFKNNGIPITN